MSKSGMIEIPHYRDGMSDFVCWDHIKRLRPEPGLYPKAVTVRLADGCSIKTTATIERLLHQIAEAKHYHDVSLARSEKVEYA